MITATAITQTTQTDVFTSVGENGITTLMICNHSAATDAVVNVWVVPSSQVTGDANQILKDLTIVAKDTFVMDMEKLVLSEGDTIILQSNVGGPGASVVNAVISSMAVA